MKTLLLVDDLEINRNLLERRLRRHDFDVLAAEDGFSCLEIAKTKQPELILLDMNLPDMDGWETARRLKAMPECAHIPIIAVSAHASVEAKNRAISAGCQDYETKPIDLSELLKKIAHWTENFHSRSDL